MIHERAMSPASRPALRRPTAWWRRGAWASRVAAVAALGAVLVWARAGGIATNWPYLNAWDEGYTVHDAETMFKFNAINPNQYTYNPLLMTMTGGLTRLWVNRLDGANAAWKFHDSVEIWSDGRGPEPNLVQDDPARAGRYREQILYDVIEPPVFLAAGRVATAAMGLASVAIFFFLLREFLEFWPALTGSAWLASIPLFALGNYVVYQEIGILFASLLACLGAQRWHATGHWGWLLLMACGTGMAPGFKSTGVAIVIVPLFVVLARPAPARRKCRDVAALTAASIFFFYYFCPGLLGKEAQIVHNALNGMSVYNQAAYAHERRYWQMALDWNVLGPILLAASAWGMIRGVRPKDAAGQGPFRFAMAVFLGVYYGFFSTFRLHAERYVLPTLPMFVYFGCFGAKEADQWLAGLGLGRAAGQPGGQRLPGRQAAILAMVFALALPSAIAGVRAHGQWVHGEDSRLAVARWLGEHARPGSRVAIMRESAFHPSALEALRRQRDLVFEEFSTAGPIAPVSCDAIVYSPLGQDRVSDGERQRLRDFLAASASGGSWREAFRAGSEKIDGMLFKPRPNRQDLRVLCRPSGLATSPAVVK